MRPADIVKIELIGMHVSIAAATNKSLVGIAGKIVDETKHLFMIEDSSEKVRAVLKKQVTISFILGGKRYTLAGSYFTGRPEERLKKIVK